MGQRVSTISTTQGPVRLGGIARAVLQAKTFRLSRVRRVFCCPKAIGKIQATTWDGAFQLVLAVRMPMIQRNPRRFCMLLRFGKRALNDEQIPMI